MIEKLTELLAQIKAMIQSFKGVTGDNIVHNTKIFLKENKIDWGLIVIIRYSGKTFYLQNKIF